MVSYILQYYIALIGITTYRYLYFTFDLASHCIIALYRNLIFIVLAWLNKAAIWWVKIIMLGLGSCYMDGLKVINGEAKIG